MSNPILMTEVNGPIAKLTMNRPGKRNAMCQELIEALEAFYFNPPRMFGSSFWQVSRGIIVRGLIFPSMCIARPRKTCITLAIGTGSWRKSSSAV